MNLFWNYLLSMFYTIYYVKVKKEYREEVLEHGLKLKHMNQNFKDFDLVKDKKALDELNFKNDDVYLVRFPIWIDLLYVEEFSFLPSLYYIEMEIDKKYLTLLESITDK